MVIINNGNFINLSIPHSCSWRALSGGLQIGGERDKTHLSPGAGPRREVKVQSYSPPGGYFLEYRKVDM